jgi:4-diphosphocytidyl-2-C-methyl-D-erythritol kinase
LKDFEKFYKYVILYFMPVLRKTRSVFAPAKVNLHLSVKDRRQDGFHNIESVFLAVNFGDTLYFSLLKGENTLKIDMQGLKSPLPPEENIIFKAVSLFRERTGFNRGLKIRVKKRIPLGGGLGGGSSDAAAALLTLNRLAGSPCSREDLLEMAGVLGSDVPFFIHEVPAALVTGRGESILPLKASKMFMVLVNPGFHSETSAAYKLIDENRVSSQTGEINKFINKDEFDEKDFPRFTNDFLNFFPEPQKSAYNEIIAKLRELGAQYANLSGSGATCFGVFADRGQAKKAAGVLRKKWSFVRECFSLFLTKNNMYLKILSL